MKKISIIVAIYNVEDYLDRCLKSIQDQTYTDYVCYCVNDGSTDNSKKIIQKYISDSRFVLLDKENGGVSDARNYGLKYVDTDYLMFVDGDDYLDIDLLKEGMNNIINSNADILMFGYKQIHLSTNSIETIRLRVEDGVYSLKDKKELLAFSPNAVWNKIYKSSLFVKKDESLSYDIQHFCQTVSLIHNGQSIDTSNAIKVRTYSPKWMIDAGYNQLIMLMTIKHIKNGLGIGSDNHQHNLSLKVLSSLPLLLEDPIASFETRNGTIVSVLDATDLNGDRIIAPIKLNGKGIYNSKEVNANFVVSVYGKNNFNNYVNNILSTNKIIYSRNKNKKQIVQDLQGLQSPNDFLPPAINNSIAQQRNNILIQSFNKGYRHQDLGITGKLLHKANIIQVVNKPLYFYTLDRPENITSFIDSKIYHIFKMSKEIIKYYKKEGIFEEYIEELEFLIKTNFIQALRKVMSVKNKKFVNKFIDDVFNFEKEHFKRAKHSYYKFIDKNDRVYLSKILTKLYYRFNKKI